VKITTQLSDEAVLAELGQRVARSRIDRGLTQAQLAEEAGLGKRTIERLEAGAATQLDSVIRILRALGLLVNLDLLLPQSEGRPLDHLEREGKRPQRASSRVSEKSKPWKWDESS